MPISKAIYKPETEYFMMIFGIRHTNLSINRKQAFYFGSTLWRVKKANSIQKNLDLKGHNGLGKESGLDIF